MDDTFNPQDVPPHNPKAFGELLYSLIRTALPQDKPKGGYQKRFAEILGIPYDRLLRWTRGNISNDRNGRSLTPELFIKLVKELWKRGALTTVEQVQIFARCAGDYKEGDIWLSYEALLNDDWFRQLVVPTASAESTPLSDHWILRSAVLSDVIGKINTRQGKVVVLQGKSGVGKSTLMAQLAQDKDVQVHFSDRIYRANPSERTALAILRDWYQQCNGITADWGDDEYKLSQDLKRKLQGQHILLLLDGVEKADQVDPLMVQDPSKGIVVIATRFPQICRDLSPDAEIIEMPGFTPAEAEDYLRSVWNVTSLDDQAALAYRAVVDWINGNPLALHYSVHRASKIGWPALLALLQELPAGPLPTDMLEEVYRPLELGYQALPADLQQAFCQIGALPELREYDLDVFRSLWNLPENQTKNRLHRLVKDFGALVPHPVDDGEVWRIHQQAFYYARHLLAGQSAQAEAINDTGWLDRYIELPGPQAEFRQIETLFPLRKLKQAIETEESYPRPSIKNRTPLQFFRLCTPEWQAITENSSVLSSQEYAVAYKLYRKEKRVNRWFEAGLGFMVILIIAMLVLGLVFNQFLSALLLNFMLFLVVAISAIFQRTYATRYHTIWHVFYRLIAERQNQPTINRTSQTISEEHTVWGKFFSLTQKFFRGSAWIALMRIVLMIFIPVSLVASLLFQWIGFRNDLKKYPPPGQLISINGYNMHINCIGTGEPTYILESGLYYGSIVWDQMQFELAENNRVCAYDRAGYFWSDPSTGDRSPETLAADLHAVLQTAQISPPYIFVTEGTGALPTYQFVQQFPGEIQSAVFIRPLSMNHIASQFSELHQLRSTISASRILAMLGFWRYTQPIMVDHLREDIRPVFRVFALTPDYYLVLGQEMDGLLASSTTDYVDGGLGDLPVLVVAPDKYAGDGELSAMEVKRFWWKSFQDVMAWSSNGSIISVDSENEDWSWSFDPSIAVVIQQFIIDSAP